MYRGDDFGGSALHVGTFHRLADAIRRGCVVRPNKLKRCFRRGTDAADALGAAMATTEKANNTRCTKREIVEMFPELDQSVIHPVSGRQSFLISIIMYLNDCSDWSREDIAAWLCRHGCQHEVKGGRRAVVEACCRRGRASSELSQSCRSNAPGLLAATEKNQGTVEDRNDRSLRLGSGIGRCGFQGEWYALARAVEDVPGAACQNGASPERVQGRSNECYLVDQRRN